jgi:hypothetical protein
VLVTSRAICKVYGPADLGRSTLIAFAQGCSYRKRTEEWLGCDARTNHGICVVSGDDRLRGCRYRICCGAQVCPGGPTRDQERTPTRAPRTIFAQLHLYRVEWRSIAVAAGPSTAFGHRRRMMALPDTLLSFSTLFVVRLSTINVTTFPCGGPGVLVAAEREGRFSAQTRLRDDRSEPPESTLPSHRGTGPPLPRAVIRRCERAAALRRRWLFSRLSPLIQSGHSSVRSTRSPWIDSRRSVLLPN